MSNVRALKLNENRSDMYVMQGGKRIEFHFYNSWRISRLKAKKLAPIHVWWFWSCNCHTGPLGVLELNEQKGVSNDQVNKH